MARAAAYHWSWKPRSPKTSLVAQARRVADGQIDKQKQNALYVDVGKAGQIISTPLGITLEAATAEFERTKRLRGSLSKTKGDVEAFKTTEYLKVFDAFRLLFGLTTVEEYNKRW